MQNPAGDEHVQQVGAAHQSRHRKTISHRLGDQRHVRRHAKARLGAAAAQTETCDHFIEDQDGAVLGTRHLRAFQIAGGRLDGALIAHGRLHDHAGDIALGQARFQPRQVVPADHVQPRGIDGVLPHAARHQHRCTFRPGRILGRRGGPQDIVEPAMIMAFKFQDDALVGGSARQAGRGLRHFRA